MKKTPQLFRRLALNSWVQGTLIFIIAFGLLLSFQFMTPGLFGFDAFYHLGMAEEMLEQGIVQDFPWLYYTVFSQNYVDHHLLFHVALMPFVFFNKIIGGKIAIALFGALAIEVFYLLMRKLKVRYAFVWAVILLISSHALLFRMNLIRAQNLSLMLLFLGLLCAYKKRYVWLLVISYLYAILFDGFIALPVLLGAYAMAGLFYSIFHVIGREIKKINEEKVTTKKGGVAVYFIPTLIALLGSVLGIVINPYFPKNLSFLYLHLIKIGMFNATGKIPVGNEWYPYELGDLMVNSSLAMLLLIFNIVILAVVSIAYLLKWRRQNALTADEIVLWLSAAAFFGVFLVAVLQSRRYIEYFVPFAILLSAVSFNNLFIRVGGREPRQYFSLSKLKITGYAFLVFSIFILLLSAGVVNLREAYGDARAVRDVYRYTGASQWLEANTAEGEIIFHLDWDDFPLLFFNNRHNYYIVGLDPVFMVDYSPELYELWKDAGRTSSDREVKRIVHEVFKSDYIFMDTEHEDAANRLDKSKLFEKVYSDEYTIVYKIK